MLRDPNAFLPNAPNFQYKEFTKSETALRYGIVNEPNEEQWQCVERLAGNILQPVRDKFGALRITSGFRCVELCNKVGSSATSNHARGQAADFEPIDYKTKMIDIIDWIHHNLEYRELIAEYFPDGWIHVAYRLNKNVKKLKLKDPSHHFAAVGINQLNQMYG